MKSRDYTLKLKPTHAPVQSTEPTKDNDDLPPHHRVGDRIQFTHDGWEYKGVVKAANKMQAVILAGRDHFLRVGQTFRQLTDNEACPHCGGFICTSDCPSKPNKPTKENMTPISFEKLAAKEKDDPISCVEGKLKYVNKPKSGKSDKGPWTIQTGVITSGGLEQAYKIWNDEPMITERDKGRILRLSSKEGAATGKGGLYLDIESWEKDGETKTKRVIKATGTAKVEFIGATEEHTSEGSQERSEGGGSSDGGRSPESRSERSSGANGGHPVWLDTVDKKWVDKFRVLSRGRKIFADLKKNPDVDLPDEFSPSDWKEMSNSVEMGYKEGYHAHPIVFAKNPATTGTSEAELAKLPEQKWEGDQSTEEEAPEEKPKPTTKKSSWKDVVHKSGVKLGEAPPHKLRNWALWAIKASKLPEAKQPKKDTEAHRFMNQMLLCVAENKWSSKTAKKFFTDSIGEHPKYENGFSDKDLENYLDCPLSELSEEKATELMARDLDEVVAEIMASIPEETEEDQVPD